MVNFVEIHESLININLNLMKNVIFLRIMAVLTALLVIGPVEGQAQVAPRVFVEMAGGVGTSYINKRYDAAGVHELDETSTYGQWSPSVGIVLNDRWSLGVRMTFQTGGNEYTLKNTITTLYGQYSFLNWHRWSMFVEGKGSYYHGIDGNDCSAGEIGLSLGGKFAITDHLSAVLHYVYTGVEIGRDRINHPKGCIGDGRYTLDFSPRRLQIGLRYSF